MRVIHVLRKPLAEANVATNVLKHGAGALNIDKCRIETEDNLSGGAYAENPTARDAVDLWTRHRKGDVNCFRRGQAGDYEQPEGRWPANLILEHHPVCTDVCVPECPVAEMDRQSGLGESPTVSRSKTTGTDFGLVNDDGWQPPGCTIYGHGDAGGASRFFKQIRGTGK